MNSGKLNGFAEVAALIRGIYDRVAVQTNNDASVVSRVARGERQSKQIEDALWKEIEKVELILAKRRLLERILERKKGGSTSRPVDP